MENNKKKPKEPNKPNRSIPAALAPMAGFTDCAFRALAARHGAVYVVSEMISSVAMVMGDKKTADLARIAPGEAPVILQIFGHDPETIKKASRALLSGSFEGCDYAAPPAGIDINMGCPVKKIVSSGDGSSLMRDAELSARIVSAAADVCETYGVPLSVKIRAGWDKNSINAPLFAVKMAENGARAITVHCRTREQMYAPSADPSVAADVRAALDAAGFAGKVLLIGNGDIDSPEAAEKYAAAGCDEVAIGRAVLGNPWLFDKLRGSEITPSREEIIAEAISLVREIVAEKGEDAGIRESRGRAAHFIRGMPGSAAMRDKLNHARTLREFEEILSGERTREDASFP